MQRTPKRGPRSAPICARSLAMCGAAALAVLSNASGTQDAFANGDTRALTMFHTHTKESATITFRRNGVYDAAGLEKLNWFLRDWRTNEPTRMDPQVFDIVWAVYRDVGATVPIHIISAYRSPKTNRMLHSRSRAVAEHSQHILGKAMDISLPGVDMNRVRAAGMRLQYGGVGFYGSSGFVHLDVAGVRAWPRMTRTQLAQLFPDGKTVHLPPDGKPLARYEEAKAEILARRGAAPGFATVAEDAAEPVTRSIWTALFSREEDGAERPGATALLAAGSEVASAGRPAPTDGQEPGTEAPAGVASDVRAFLSALIAPARVSEPASSSRKVRVTMSRAKPLPLQADELPLCPDAQLASRLSESPSFDLTSASFAGPAVKPLPAVVAKGG